MPKALGEIGFGAPGEAQELPGTLGALQDKLEPISQALELQESQKRDFLALVATLLMAGFWMKTSADGREVSLSV